MLRLADLSCRLVFFSFVWCVVRFAVVVDSLMPGSDLINGWASWRLCFGGTKCFLFKSYVSGTYCKLSHD
ncbi:hypothetical protein Ddye_027317 [Dipteronia dyeriana]|uniref:Uncharacterized protein n=1 Tax=Dipteronia dyeriana TaxID=168575 RepID=A0AAD9TPB3_9ROSI|nr:hypothetical protein Ddye_027317 [Dipteronia dyeriana]